MTIKVETLQNGGYTGQDDRNAIQAIFAKSAAVTAKAGIIPSDGTDLVVSAQGTPNMTVNVTKGDLIIPDASGGAYLFHNSASDQNPTIGTAPSSGTRYDLIIARVYDNAAGDSQATSNITLPGAGGTQAVQTITGTIEVVAGTAGGSPAPPSLPNARCVVLAIVHVRTSTTSIVSGDIQTSQSTTSRVGFTVAAGGSLPCASASAYPATPYPGMCIYDVALGYDLEWNGSLWKVRSGLVMEFVRTSANVSDAFANSTTAFTTVASGTWSSAPAGDYVVECDVAYSGSAVAFGFLQLTVGSTVVTQDANGNNMRMDVGNASAAPQLNAHRTRKYTHGGGNLAFSLGLQIQAGTGTVFTAGTGITAQFVG